MSNKTHVYYAPDVDAHGLCPECGHPIGDYRVYEDGRIVALGTWCWCNRDRIESGSSWHGWDYSKKDEPGDWRRAIGVLPIPEGGLSPEEAIRRGRE